MNALELLYREGQSIWLDYIRRDLLAKDGELSRLIGLGMMGMTSNPTIFEKAIGGSNLYDETIQAWSRPHDMNGLYDALTWEDIGAAADLFRPVYDRTDQGDGYVSIEVSPLLARDTEGTVSEARRIWKALNRPNIMVKVPATEAGIPAIRTLIGEGININVTLIFSLKRYQEVIEAYLTGLEDRRAGGGSVKGIASVASFFVSRVDTLVDKKLEALVQREPPLKERCEALKGQAAVANAKLAYRLFQEAHDAPRFQELAAAGARPQRTLWASTSTKNPAYPDLLYVDQLIGPHTVNTVPPATLDAILDHVVVARTVDHALDVAEGVVEKLEGLGIHMEAVTSQLEHDGVESFEQSFQSLMDELAKKAQHLS